MVGYGEGGSEHIREGVPTKTYLEHRGIAVDEFLQMIRFE